MIQSLYVVIVVTLTSHGEGQPTTSVADEDEKSCRSMSEDYYALKTELSQLKARVSQLEALIPPVEGSITFVVMFICVARWDARATRSEFAFLLECGKNGAEFGEVHPRR